METPFSDQLTSLNATQQSIQAASAYFLYQSRSNPTIVPHLIEAWSQAVESLPHKVALMFLANDIIQNEEGDLIKSSFQPFLLKAIAIAVSQPDAVGDINQVIRVWEERNVYPKHIVEEFKWACETYECRAYRVDNAVISHVIRLAKSLKRLDDIKQQRRDATYQQMVGITAEFQNAHKKLVEELVQVLKKMNHAHLEECIYLQRVYKAIELRAC